MRLKNSERSTDHRTPRAGDTTFPAPPASQPLLGLLGGAGKQHVLNGATVFPGGAAWSPNPSPTLTVDGAYVLRLIQTDNDAAPFSARSSRDLLTITGTWNGLNLGGKPKQG